jgi:hypothetical protein
MFWLLSLILVSQLAIGSSFNTGSVQFQPTELKIPSTHWAFKLFSLSQKIVSANATSLGCTVNAKFPLLLNNEGGLSFFFEESEAPCEPLYSPNIQHFLQEQNNLTISIAYQDDFSKELRILAQFPLIKTLHDLKCFHNISIEDETCKYNSLVSDSPHYDLKLLFNAEIAKKGSLLKEKDENLKINPQMLFALSFVGWNLICTFVLFWKESPWDLTRRQYFLFNLVHGSLGGFLLFTITFLVGLLLSCAKRRMLDNSFFYLAPYGKTVDFNRVSTSGRLKVVDLKMILHLLFFCSWFIPLQVLTLVMSSLFQKLLGAENKNRDMLLFTLNLWDARCELEVEDSDDEAEEETFSPFTVEL